MWELCSSSWASDRVAPCPRRDHDKIFVPAQEDEKCGAGHDISLRISAGNRCKFSGGTNSNSTESQITIVRVILDLCIVFWSFGFFREPFFMCAAEQHMRNIKKSFQSRWWSLTFWRRLQGRCFSPKIIPPSLQIGEKCVQFFYEVIKSAMLSAGRRKQNARLAAEASLLIWPSVENSGCRMLRDSGHGQNTRCPATSALAIRSPILCHLGRWASAFGSFLWAHRQLAADAVVEKKNNKKPKSQKVDSSR